MLSRTSLLRPRRLAPSIRSLGSKNALDLFASRSMLSFKQLRAASPVFNTRANESQSQSQSWRQNSHILNFCIDRHLHCYCNGSSLYSVSQKTEQRFLSTNIHPQRDEEEGEKISNRAAFKSTPIIPSILAHIEKIGVGIRQRSKNARRKSSLRKNNAKNNSKLGKSSSSRGGGGDTLDEIEESEYFKANQTRHRLEWQRKHTTGERGAKAGKNPHGMKKRSASAGHGRTDEEESERNRGAYWLPPPPFSSFSKGDAGPKSEGDSTQQQRNGRRIVRRPVKLLGSAGSLNDPLPRQSRGLSEVAIAGRSNVGKSTLLNALLYGNTDESLSPRKMQRGKTPDGAKLPRGVKAVTSSKPGQTKELTFYQLTADVLSQQRQQRAGSSSSAKTKQKNSNYDDDDDDEDDILVAKMSLLLVDLPGYGFAFAKEERTKEWKDLMHHYLLERKGLKRILLLLDARHGFKKADFDFLADLQDGLAMASADEGNKKIRRDLPPIQIVLTKCDLVKQADLARRVVVVRQQLSDFLTREPSSLPVMLVSARAGLGFNNIRRETPMGGVLELQRELASLVPVPRVHQR